MQEYSTISGEGIIHNKEHKLAYFARILAESLLWNPQVKKIFRHGLTSDCRIPLEVFEQTIRTLDPLWEQPQVVVGQYNLSSYLTRKYAENSEDPLWWQKIHPAIIANTQDYPSKKKWITLLRYLTNEGFIQKALYHVLPYLLSDEPPYPGSISSFELYDLYGLPTDPPADLSTTAWRPRVSRIANKLQHPFAQLIIYAIAISVHDSPLLELEKLVSPTYQPT